MIRLICPLLLISTILCVSLHADTDGAKAPAPAKSFPFAPPANIKPGAYDVKLEAKEGVISCYTDPKGLPARVGADVTTLVEYTVTVAPANKKREQVLELTIQRLQGSGKNTTTTTKETPTEREESFDSRHPKQAKGMKCIAKRMNVVGKKARWTLCKGALVKRDGFKQLIHKAELPEFDETEFDETDYEAKMAVYDDAMSANLFVSHGEGLFPQYTRTLLPVKPAKVGDTWKRKVDLAAWICPASDDVSIPAKVTCTLSKVEGTIATVTFVIEIPPCTYTSDGRTIAATGKKKGKGSLQYDLATQLIMAAQVSFTVELVTHDQDEDLSMGPVTAQFQRTLTITPKKTKAKTKTAPTKTPAN
jgi:hypothetical protein